MRSCLIDGEVVCCDERGVGAFHVLCRRRNEPLRGVDVVEVLERVGRQVGFPATIRVDQGTEFVSRDLDLWAYQRGVTLDFSRPGKPTDNVEAFLVPEPCRRPEKIGGLAQVLQRRTPALGDRAKAPDYVAEARWRSQPTIVKKLPAGDPKFSLSARGARLKLTVVRRNRAGHFAGIICGLPIAGEFYQVRFDPVPHSLFLKRA